MTFKVETNERIIQMVAKELITIGQQSIWRDPVSHNNEPVDMAQIS